MHNIVATRQMRGLEWHPKQQRERIKHVIDKRFQNSRVAHAVVRHDLGEKAAILLYRRQNLSFGLVVKLVGDVQTNRLHPHGLQRAPTFTPLTCANLLIRGCCSKSKREAQMPCFIRPWQKRRIAWRERRRRRRWCRRRCTM